MPPRSGFWCSHGAASVQRNRDSDGRGVSSAAVTLARRCGTRLRRDCVYRACYRAQSRHPRDESARSCSSTRRKRDRPQAPAISSAVPSRPIGWRSMKCLAHRLLGRPVFFASVAMRSSSEGDSIVPGQIAFTRMPLLDVVGRDRLGEPDHRRLGGAIDIAERDAAHRRGARRDIDDRALALLQHAGQRRPDGAVHRADVEVEGEVPFLVGRSQAPCRGARSRRRSPARRSGRASCSSP